MTLILALLQILADIKPSIKTDTNTHSGTITGIDTGTNTNTNTNMGTNTSLYLLVLICILTVNTNTNTNTNAHPDINTTTKLLAHVPRVWHASSVHGMLKVHVVYLLYRLSSCGVCLDTICQPSHLPRVHCHKGMVCQPGGGGEHIYIYI